MKTSRQQFRLYLLLVWLCIPLSWPAFSQQADKAEAPIDLDVYEELMAHEVTDFVDLEIVLRGERAHYEVMTPPASDFILRQPIDPVLPFSWERFSKELPDILGDRYEYEYSVPVYKLRAVEDRATRQLIFYGKDDEALFALDQPKEYDPFARLKSQYPGLYSGRYSAAEVKEFEAAYDPARVELMVTLIPTEYVEPYLYAQAKVVEYQLSLMDEPGDGGFMMMSMGTDSNIVITSLMKLTNGLQLEIGYPETFTNRLDIYRATDVMERDWKLISAPLETTGTIGIVWLNTEPGGYRVGFYAVGNHDLDGDGDGFSDAFEILVLGTDPNDPGSHGVYLSGEILYAGPESGTIYVQAVTDSADSWSKTWQTSPSAPGHYTNLVANQQSYWFKSFMDVNSNQQHDEWEPWGIYSANAMPATNDITDLDITLADQPSIWGTLVYSGGATGDIHVLASPVADWDTTYSAVIPWVQAHGSLTGDPVYVSFPVNYSITGLPPGDYIVRAFIDEDGNGQYTHLEDGGQYAVDPIAVSNRVTGIDFGIGLDTDADGIPDWWEMEHFGGATNALLSADSDSDGLDNLTEYQAGTDPDNSDTDGDSLDDGEEVGVFNTNPASWDSDGDGVSDGSEVDQGYDPNDPDDTPEAEWFIVTGDLDEDIPKSRIRTITIPAGEQRALIVAIFSEEYPHYTGQASQFNDTLEWNIVPSAGSPIADSVDVNNRHTQWDEQGTNVLGFDPAYIEDAQIIAAPLDAPLTLTITLSAVNIGDGALPSTVMVGLPILKIDTETVATVPADRTRKKVGVGEEVELTLQPSSLSPVTWSITGDGTLSSTTGNPVTFTAHDRASAPIVTATYGGGSCHVTFNVVEPSHESAIKIGPDHSYPAGMQGAGMNLEITVHPTDVSFMNAEFREVSGPATGHSGYFLQWGDPQGQPYHQADVWQLLSFDNKWTDEAEFREMPSPWSAGSFQWVIPMQWRGMGGSYTGALPDRIQTFTIHGTNGMSTVSKLGQSATRTP